ncbi:MAG: hypothetical protein ACK4SN_11010, partial [Bellilinea sp.]
MNETSAVAFFHTLAVLFNPWDLPDRLCRSAAACYPHSGDEPTDRNGNTGFDGYACVFADLYL